MQDHPFAFEALQPFVKLAQANMELVTRYAWSPEVFSEALRTPQLLFEQNHLSFAKLAQSNPFLELMQGLMQNYTEFLGELSRSTYALMSHGPASFMQQAFEAGGNVVRMAGSGGRR